MSLDVARVRATFPALADGTAYFDGPGGSQVPRPVADAVAATLTSGISNRGRVTEAERRADDVVVGARAAVADLLGVAAGGVVFGRSMTQLTYEVARALAKQWRPGDEVVVTRLDHDANIRPWCSAAAAAGATARFAAFDRGSAELSVDDVAAQIGPHTRLVAVTGASNLLGTRPDLPRIAEAAHAVGALVYLDGVHLTPHAPVDVPALGADFFACSPYKFFGPHLGVLAGDPALLDTLRPDKLLPASDAVPERFEQGTLPYELLAGTTAAVDFIADMAEATDEPDRSRRERVLASMRAVEGHEDRLFGRLIEGLCRLDAVTVHGAPARRTPTALFSVAGRSAHSVFEGLAEHRVNAPAGSFYALEASRWIGLGDEGAVRAGLAPYTDDDDVERLLDALAKLTR